MGDATEHPTASQPTTRVLSSWEERLFAGVRMLSPAEQAELAASPRHRSDVGDGKNTEDYRWYGQRLSGTGGPASGHEEAAS
ncbi:MULTISPECIES: hypothetical protein [Streptomycetaceae]|nr:MULTISPECIES: hypothetical protein [Streptomycetaceae]MYS59767.1 hypothetical protein [Streptomyces sp. SID5468]CCB75531.1 protein of unknown function [Streptantibioticus cattleyicolor NRRL 8057 = DSM 46488]